MEKKEDKKEDYKGTVNIIGPTWALEPLTYVTEYLAEKGFYVRLFVEGLPPTHCIPTPGHPCP